MLRLRQVAAPRIVKSRRVVLDWPHFTSDGVVLGDMGDSGIVKVSKGTLKEAWRNKTDRNVRGGRGDFIFVGKGRNNEVWDNDGKLLWKPPSRLFNRRDSACYRAEDRLHFVDARTGEMLRTVELPPGKERLALFDEDADIALLGPLMTTDPICAFSLSSKRVMWERDLVPQVKERLGDECTRGMGFRSKPAGVLAFTGQHVLSLAAATGDLQWGIPMSLSYMDADVRDGRIYGWSTAVAQGPAQTTFDVARGEITRGTPAPAGDENRFVIADEETGKVLTDVPLARCGEAFRRFVEPTKGAMCKNHLAFSTRRDNLMVVFRLSDGAPVWQHRHSADLFAPMYDDNRLYVPCSDGTLVVFEAEGDEL